MAKRPARSESHAKVDVSTVLQSYALAYQDGLLRSRLIPTVGESCGLPGHPLGLVDRQDSLKAAMLDAHKISDVKADLHSVLSKVPKSQDWVKAVEKEHLALDEVWGIIRLVRGEAHQKARMSFRCERTIDSLVETFRDHTENLQGTKWQHHHAQRLAKLIECLLMQIQEHTHGGNRNASATVCRQHQHLDGFRTDHARPMQP